ncbi:MAG: hypothetical protein KJ709_04265 [Nanoarchaeota archaeon]|nr:hypothetical protein [Nanoarchaeota archaeon]
MIRKQDIHRAVSLFKAWDNEGRWDKPSALFINHTLAKAEDSLKTARALRNIMADKELMAKCLPGTEFDPALWVINASYYSMFFQAQALLALDGRKMPEGTRDTHRTTLMAFMYYFIIKGSGVEGRRNLSWDDIKRSRLSDALLMLQEAKEETDALQQRAKDAVHSLKLELEKRAELTYRTTRDVELSIAKTSIGRAERFRQIIREYMHARGLGDG